MNPAYKHPLLRPSGPFSRLPGTSLRSLMGESEALQLRVGSRGKGFWRGFRTFSFLSQGGNTTASFLRLKPRRVALALPKPPSETPSVVRAIAWKWFAQLRKALSL